MNFVKRVKLVILIKIIFFIILIVKLIIIQGIDYTKKAKVFTAKRMITEKLPAIRGTIYDSQYNILAQTVQSYNILINKEHFIDELNINQLFDNQFNVDNITKYIHNTNEDRKYDKFLNLLHILKIEIKELKNICNDKKGFTYLAKNINKDIKDKVLNLNINSISFESTFKRIYPFDNIAGNLIGYINIDNLPLSGLEYTQDQILKGTDGKRRFESGADGIRIPLGENKTYLPTDGLNIKLTINTDIQWYAQKIIKQQVRDTNAEWGSIIVMEVKTGNIIAMSESNNFNPNLPYSTHVENQKVYSVCIPIEPGSTDKIVTAAAVLETGKTNVLEHIEIPPVFEINGENIKDAFEHGYQQKTFAGIIGSSLNTGIVIIGSRLSLNERYEWFKKFGIGEKTNIGILNEQKGYLLKPELWDKRQQYNILFGQGLTQTVLQTTNIFNTIANNGLRISPKIIHSYFDSQGKKNISYERIEQQIISKKTAQDLQNILESAVTEGDLKSANIPGYRIGGKTGTAEASRENSLGYDGYTASFIGMAPMNDPKYVINVTVHRPKGNIYGISTIPAFKLVMKRVLNTFTIYPSTENSVHLPQFY